MAIAHTRAVFGVFGVSLRSGLMAAASGAILVALAPAALALPNCTGDGTANTCVIDLTNVATEVVDGGGASDKLQFTVPGLNLNANTIGTALAGTVRFANFEEAQVIAGAGLTLTGSGSGTQSLTWTIDAGGGLTALGGNAIGDISAMTVNGSFGIGLDSLDETIGSLAGTGLVELLNLRTLTLGGNGGTTTFAGIISGTGNLNKLGSGVLTLTGDSSYTGTTSVLGGVLEIGHADAINDSSAVTIGIAGTVRSTTVFNIGGAVVNNGYLTGNMNIAGNVSNNGLLRPGLYIAPPDASSPSPPAFGTIAMAADFTASGTTSFFDMEVNLDAALPGGGTPGSTHDFISIAGNVTGTNKTLVFLSEFDAAVDSGQATTGNGIHLIDVGGTGGAGSFVQANALNSGAYQYLLTYVADHSGVPGSADGYFLQSAVRDELFAQPALLTAGQNLIRNCFRDDQRVPDSPKGASFGRAWFGYHQGNSSYGADTGLEMDQDFSCTSGGMDWRLGHGWFGGVSGGFGSTTVDLPTPAGGGKLDGDARVIEAYASFTSSSLFVNLSGGYADMDWAYLGALLGDAEASSSGFIGSAQAGVALDADVVAVKLFGSVNYDGTNCGDSCFGFAVSEDTGTVEAKGTVRFDGVSWGGSVRPWAAVSYTDILSGGVNSAAVGAVSVSSDSLDQLLSLDAGLQTYLDENLSLFLDGGYHESLGKDVSGYKGGIGLKLYW